MVLGDLPGVPAAGLAYALPGAASSVQRAGAAAGPGERRYGDWWRGGGNGGGRCGGGVVELGPDVLAVVLHRPAVRGAESVDEVETESAVRRIAADGRRRRAAGRG